jgi:serine/threonine-protein kinase
MSAKPGGPRRHSRIGETSGRRCDDVGAVIPDTAEAPPPSRLGRYELLGRLATGGMAEIYLARLAGEAGFEKTVVVKRLHPALAAADDYVRMFLDEGKLVARLDHPNVCEVHELGRDGSDYFLAMPFLDGVAATELIARPRDPNRIVQLRVAAGVIVQACAGMHHAHELRGPDGALLGLVHRDASPSNLFVTTSGVVKVLDFGIAKVRGAQATEVGVIKGKWQYMAPEQVLGEDLDRRCDVFALGIVLFELATHQRLFKRDSEFLAARAVLEEPIPRADEVDPAVPRALADVVAKALARDKAARYPDAHALGDAIETAMAEHGGVATPSEIAGALALEHADELTAQRTRRLRIVDHAREESTVATVRRTVDEVAASARAPTEEVVSKPTAAAPTTERIRAPVRTAPSDDAVPRRGGSRRTIVAVLATLTLAAGAIVAIVLAMVPGDEPEGVGSSRRDEASRATSTAANPVPAGSSNATGSSAPPPAGDSNVAAPQASAHDIGSEAPPREVEMPPVRVGSRPAPPKPPGQLSVESSPFAKVFFDGRLLGITPIIHLSVPAGKHRLRAVLADGRTKDWTVDVPPGHAAPPFNLSW